jgi:hypothetical protein
MKPVLLFYIIFIVVKIKATVLLCSDLNTVLMCSCHINLKYGYHISISRKEDISHVLTIERGHGSEKGG